MGEVVARYENRNDEEERTRTVSGIVIVRECSDAASGVKKRKRYRRRSG